MIDNVVLLVTGALQHKSLKEVLAKCHPLGRFAEMEAVSVAETPSDLFSAVLVETPLGRCVRVTGHCHRHAEVAVHAAGFPREQCHAPQAARRGWDTGVISSRPIRSCDRDGVPGRAQL